MQARRFCGTADLDTATICNCSICTGMHPFYVPRSDPDQIDVNARYVDAIDLSALKPEYFDDMNWERGMGAKVSWR